MDQEELELNTESSPGEKGQSINKLIKSYKKSRNATKKINKIKNKIKKNKTKNNPNSKNTVVGHPDGEKRILSQIQGPDDPRPLYNNIRSQADEALPEGWKSEGDQDREYSRRMEREKKNI